MRKRLIPTVLVVVLCVAAVPALAGIHYRAMTTTEAVDGKGRPQVMEVEGWVDGEKAKITFTETFSPLTPKGSYLLTEDGARTVYLVNPEQQTYARWSIEGMLGLVGGILQGLQGVGSFQFSEPQVEKLLEESGGKLHSLDTQHYRYRTTYALDVKVLGFRQSTEVDSLQDFWTTSQLSDTGLGLWLRKDPPKTGDANFDKLLDAETAKMVGFPLKTITVTTQRQIKKKTGKVGKETVTRSTMEVTSLSQESVPDSHFVLPTGYREVPMLLGDEEEGGGNPLRGLLRRRQQ